MTGRLNGSVAFVTGAASGIGRATALLFATEGASVVAADIDADALQALLGQLAGECQHVGVTFDVSDEQAWIQAIADVQARFGRLDVLVNNAGILLEPAPVTAIDLTTWRRLMSVNVDGVFLGTKNALPLLRQDGGGSIVNVSSIAGIRPSANAAAYAASKGAVRLFTKAVALECAAAQDGVRVNSIHPGMIETPIWDAMMPGARSGGMTLNALTTGTVPMGRAGTAEEIAAGVLWLASSESSYMTGSELVIDGGRAIG
jgi:NAD(P)-dependent dehydrogenase (short-subunit alcohol dehydrogenase family)